MTYQQVTTQTNPKPLDPRVEKILRNRHGGAFSRAVPSQVKEKK